MSLKSLAVVVLPILIIALWFWYGRENPMAKEWSYTRDSGKVLIDVQRTGQIRHWSLGPKVFVDGANGLASPLRLELTNGGVAHFEAASFAEETKDAGRVLVIQGVLRNDQVNLPARIQYVISPDASQIRVSFSVSPPKEESMQVRSWDWSLPLALSPRKQVYFRGENALDWETRYFYQFTARADQLMPRPDRNEWRWFALDQLGPEAFRLWKAESETVSALVMQEGKNIPPYVQVRNPDHGITIEYPELAKTAPKSLRIDASAGATAQIQIWPAFVSPARADTPGLFGIDHEIILTAAATETSLFARRAELNAQYAATRRPDPNDILREPEWLRSTPISQTTPQYVTGGYPFAQGQLRNTESLAVYVAGEKVPYQARTLGFWPDGSAKWVLLTFPIKPEKAVAECPPPRVTLRTGKSLPVQVSIDPAPGGLSLGMPAPALAASVAADGGVEIQNGTFFVKIAKGPQWLSLQREGRPILAPKAGHRLAYADYVLDPKSVFPFSGILEGGHEDRGVLTVDKIELEQAGPLVAVVRLEGMTDNQEPTRIILRIRVEAGRPELRLTHTAEFLFKDPRRTFLQDLGIELSLPGFNLAHASLGGKVGQNEKGTTELVQETLFSRIIRLSQTPVVTRKTVEGHGGWIEASNNDTQFLGIIRNFTETAPKAIAISPEHDSVRFKIWPRSAGLMDVRRYSNYPHLIQGESTTSSEDWVQKDYYANDPFVGESRSHEILLSFWPGKDAPDAQAAVADFQSPPLLFAGWERYVSAGVILPEPSRAEWPRAWDAWTQFATFWLYHRALHNWYGFWDFGDFRHHFQSGYGWIFPPQAVAEVLREPAKLPTLKGKQIEDYRPPNDWAFDNGRWGWSNAEGLSNLFLQHEYLRNGNRVVYFAAEAMARFSRDVVIRQDGKWLGRGTRHGVQHWSDGNHEERQTTSTEFRLHYFLNGDERTRDVVNKLYDRYYSKTAVTGEAQHSGRWGGLYFHWEMSGSAQEAAQLKAYAHTFIAPNGLYLSPSVKFPGPIVQGAPKSLNGGSMFFHTYGAMHNLLEYQQATGDEALAEAIIKMADETIKTPEIQKQYFVDNYGSDTIYFPPIAFAALHAADPVPYRTFLTKWLQGGAWKRLYQTVTKNPNHWSGQTAFLHGNMPGCLFWTNWAPYITRALEKDSLWNPEIANKIEKVEKEGKPSRPSTLSWQTEFDGVEGLSEYMDSQKPWNQKTDREP